MCDAQIEVRNAAVISIMGFAVKCWCFDPRFLKTAPSKDSFELIGLQIEAIQLLWMDDNWKK